MVRDVDLLHHIFYKGLRNIYKMCIFLGRSNDMIYQENKGIILYLPNW